MLNLIACLLTRTRLRFTIPAALFCLILAGCSSSKYLNHTARGEDYSPLYVVNGDLQTSPEARNTYLLLKQKYFADINLLNTKQALAQYGSEGKYGAVQVTLTDSVKAYTDLLDEYNSDEWSKTKSTLHIKTKGKRNPKLIGGMRLLQQRAKYPEECLKKGSQGRVFLQFIVTEQGQVQNPKVINGIHWACNQEALRVIKTTKFLPALVYGKPIKVQSIIYITFRR